MKPIYALPLLALGASSQRYKSPLLNAARRAVTYPYGQVNFTKTCSADLTNFEFPHLIVPIDSQNPDTVRGTSFNATVSPTISSVFNFDIPNSASGLTCTLWFLFPDRDSIFSGDGIVRFSRLAEPATMGTTYNNVPPVQEQLSDVLLSPGRNYNMTSFECPANQKIAFRMDSGGSTVLNYFQDSRDPP
ncbi:hypothetical protein AJ79_07048 [Helicocarpus griseus UAMH5409]|uniref:Ubiquitin 3 binding protein But2 C-terminal domain-containing protein n=1 Tax=Helicocarpus griseus UAMH5409 TaxID=1447875 RepID=A0A2B7X714_9EURO|nr:hypothetical protein AJ79_07048 [Helicocarpus griseus UAMH5409]